MQDKIQLSAKFKTCCTGIQRHIKFWKIYRKCFSPAWDELVAPRVGWAGGASRGTSWSRLVRDDFTSLRVSCPYMQTFLNARDILWLVLTENIAFSSCYSLGIVCVYIIGDPNKSPQQYRARVTCSPDLSSPVFKSVLLCTKPCKYAKYFGQALVNDNERIFLPKKAVKKLFCTNSYNKVFTLCWRS